MDMVQRLGARRRLRDYDDDDDDDDASARVPIYSLRYLYSFSISILFRIHCAFSALNTFSASTLLVGRQEGRPACKKTEWWGAGSLDRGADLHIAQVMPLPLTVSCFSKIQIGFTFLVPAHLGSPGQRVVKRVCVRIHCVTNRLQKIFLAMSVQKTKVSRLYMCELTTEEVHLLPTYAATLIS